jgi:hypothetical protein
VGCNISYVFSSTKSENKRAEQILPRVGRRGSTSPTFEWKFNKSTTRSLKMGINLTSHVHVFIFQLQLNDNRYSSHFFLSTIQLSYSYCLKILGSLSQFMKRHQGQHF